MQNAREKVARGGYPWFCPEHYEDLFDFETEVVEIPERKPHQMKRKARRSK